MSKQSAAIPLMALCPEDELLLCCAQTSVSAKGGKRIRRLLEKDLDWDDVTKRALRHGILPLLYWSLKNTCQEAVPKVAMDQLRDYFHANDLHNILLTNELLKLLNLFQDYGIPAIPFKGPILAVSAYSSLSLRQFSDLDILVPKQRITEAKNLCLSNGYRLYQDLPEASCLRYQHAYPLIRHDGRVSVDLHWRIVEKLFPLRVDVNYFHANTIGQVSLAGVSVLSLPPEDMILILYVHGCKHYWVQLKLICDFAKFIDAHPSIKWELVLRQACEYGSQRMLFLALLLANTLLELPLPSGLSQKVVKDQQVRQLASDVCQRLFTESTKPPRFTQSIALFFNMRERLRDRVRYLFSRRWITPTIRDREILSLPSGLSFLYYLVRPFRLIKMYKWKSAVHLLKSLLGP